MDDELKNAKDVPLGDDPDAPYPGMATAFESHFGQSWTDRDWRSETSVWAAAWKAALAKNANAAPQDQDAKDAARYRMARFKGTISDEWQESLDHWIALDAALAAMEQKT